MGSSGISEVVEMEVFDSGFFASAIEGSLDIRQMFSVWIRKRDIFLFLVSLFFSMNRAFKNVLTLSFGNPHQKLDHVVIQKLVVYLISLLLFRVGEQVRFQVNLLPLQAEKISFP